MEKESLDETTKNEWERIQSLLSPQFTIRDNLGSGTYGSVWLCEDNLSPTSSSMKKTVAIKVMTFVDNKKNKKISSSLLRRRNHALNEENIWNLVNGYSNIVPKYDNWNSLDNQNTFTSMKYCNRKDLFEFLFNNPTLSSSSAPMLHIDTVFVGVLNALHIMHDIVHIAHRDVKLENVFVHFDETNKKYEIYLGDFTFSTECSPHETPFRNQMGSEEYFSPQLWHKEQSWGQDADCWAAGVLLYRFFTLEHPYWDEDQSREIRECALEFESLPNHKPRRCFRVPCRWNCFVTDNNNFSCEQRLITPDQVLYGLSKLLQPEVHCRWRSVQVLNYFRNMSF